jgi:hypothetical protein
MTNLGKLRPEIKTLWLEALRSGQYKQTKNFLHVVDNTNGDGLCCLGVLCELAVQAGVIGAEHTENDDTPVVAYGYGSVTMPPEAVKEWAYDHLDSPNLHNEWAVLDLQGAPNSLPVLNDEYGFTFAEIADRIEASL